MEEQNKKFINWILNQRPYQLTYGELIEFGSRLHKILEEIDEKDEIFPLITKSLKITKYILEVI